MRASTLALALLCIAGSGAAGCGPPAHVPGAACEVDGGPTGCGRSCGENRPCEGGLYCTERGLCTADCSAAVPCRGGEVCGPAGLCVVPRDAGRRLDT